MKLQNALSGYQLASGIGAVHLGYLVAMMVFLDKEVPDSDLVNLAIIGLKWAHFFCAAIAIIAWFCEVFQENFWSSLLSVTFVFIDQAAIFFALYAYCYADYEVRTVYLMWLLIEICTFYGFVLSGIIFLLLSSTIHFKQQTHVDHSQKRNTDFLQYVQFQYIWFSLYMTLFFTTLFILVLAPEQECEWPSSYFAFMIVLLVLHSVQAFVTGLQNFTERNLQIEVLIVTVPVSGGVLIVMIIFFQFLGGCQPSMGLWIKTEMVIFITSFANLLGDYLLQSQQQFFKREEYQKMYEKPHMEEEPLDKLYQEEGKENQFSSALKDEQEKLIRDDSKLMMKQSETPGPTLDIRPGFYSISFCSFIKEIKARRGITLIDSYRNFYNCLFVFGFQLILTLLLGYDIFIVGQTTLVPAPFDILVVRFICAIILHLRIEGSVRMSLDMLKYANNQPEDLVAQAAPLMIIFIVLAVQIVIEVMNLLIICSQTQIMDVFQKFIMLTIITEIDHLYARSLLSMGGGKERPIQIPLKRSGKDIPFSSRPVGNKVVRAIYRVLRVLYVSYYFYFMAYTVIPLTYLASLRY